MSRTKRDDLLCGSWMYKPKSKGKSQSAVASLFASIGSKKWSKRWVWTSTGALFYSPKATVNPENTITFEQVLDARVVSRNGMSKEGCPDNLLDFGWVLCCKDKDIVFASSDADTRNRYVQFFLMQKKLRQSGYDDERAVDVEEFRRKLGGFDLNGNDDRESMLDTQSSVAFEEDDEGFRLDDDYEEDNVVDDVSSSPGNSRSKRQSMARRSVSFEQEWDDVDGGTTASSSTTVTATPATSTRPRLTNDSLAESSRQLSTTQQAPRQQQQAPPAQKSASAVRQLLRRTVTKAMEARSSYDVKMKRALAERHQPSDQESHHPQLSKQTSVEDLSLEAAAQRTFQRERRWFEAMPPISTGHDVVKSFHVYNISALSGFAQQLNDYVLLNREDRCVGVAIGTIEGLLLRAAGEIDSTSFGVFVSVLNRSTWLHGGNEPVVTIESDDGKIVTCNHQHGRFVVVTISAAK